MSNQYEKEFSMNLQFEKILHLLDHVMLTNKSELIAAAYKCAENGLRISEGDDLK